LVHGIYEKKVVFVRFNPNKNPRVRRDKGMRAVVEKFETLERLLVLQSWLLAVTLDTAKFSKVTVLYLFYSHDSKRLWEAEGR
jgi:hypothetical protein